MSKDFPTTEFPPKLPAEGNCMMGDDVAYRQ